jgi:hypothetical protein
MDARIRADLDLPIIAAAPFNDVERRWLIAFVRETLDKQMPTKAPPKAPAEEETTPWKDPAMPLAERMTLAIGRPLLARMTAAVAQQDCGQCGYTCADYSRAIFEQAEPRLNLCAPGGKATARMPPRPLTHRHQKVPTLVPAIRATRPYPRGSLGAVASMAMAPKKPRCISKSTSRTRAQPMKSVIASAYSLSIPPISRTP